MTPDTADGARWICFAPREHSRERDFLAVSQDPVQPAEVTSAFELLAESALPPKDSLVPLWQYVFLGPRGYSLLMRGAVESRDGASARVVWGLLLPFRFVTSARFCLEECTRLFPSHRYSGWPEPVALESLPDPAPADEAAANLAGALITSAPLRVNIGALGETLTRFCRAIEQLPPADRLTTSFSTGPVGKRALEHDPAAGPLPESRSGRALLRLWDILKEQVEALPDTLPDLPPEIDKHVHRSVSLAGEPGSWLWLACLLRRPRGLVKAFAQLAARLEEPFDSPGHPQAQELRPVQDALLQGGFDGYLAQASPAEVATALDQLQQAQLLEAQAAGEDLIAPLRPLMAATRRGVLSAVQPDTLATLLTGHSARGRRTEGVARYLLKTLQEDSAPLNDLVAGLRRLPQRLPASAGAVIAARCEESWTSISAELHAAAQPERGMSEGSTAAVPGLAAALGSLALHAAARPPELPPAALQRFLHELGAGR